MDAYSLAVVVLSSIGMAVIAGWLVFGRRDENGLSAVHSQIGGLDERMKSTQNRINVTDQNALAAVEHFESSLNQLAERVTALEANLTEVTDLSQKHESDVTDVRRETQRLAKANASIFDDLAKILKHINATKRSADGPTSASQKITELKD